MSLLKLPLLLVSSVSWHLALYSSLPDPGPGDKVAMTSCRERIWTYAAQPCNLFIKGTTWLVAAAESLVIINAALQDAPLRSSSQTMSAVLDVLGPADASKITPSFVVGTLLVTAAGIVRVLCYRALGPLFTFEQCIRKDHRLVTTGPYAVVRHPGYTGLLMGIVGSCVLYGSPDAWVRTSGVLTSLAGRAPWVRPVLGGWWVIMAASCVTLFRRTTDEDRLLSERFGKEWENWARRVKYKLVPYVY